MKRLSLLVILGLLAACQSPSIQPNSLRASTPANSLQSQSAARPTAQANSPQLSSAFLRQLEGFDEEGDPSVDTPNARMDQQLVSQTIGTAYTKAHSYYFQTLDQGKSSVEAILAHDGHTEAARLVRHWTPVLGENAVWPDKQSTSYQGPWPALEHAELKNSGGWFMFKAASTKADEYYGKAVAAWRKDLPADHANQTEAWAWLARASHFLQDVTVPFHTISLIRPAQLLCHNRYEVTCDQHFNSYLPSRNHNPQGVWANGPYPASGPWGIYFNPGTTAGAMIRQNADFSRKFYKFVNERENTSTQNWERTRAVMVPLGAKTTAGMIQSFLRDVGATR